MEPHETRTVMAPGVRLDGLEEPGPGLRVPVHGSTVASVLEWVRGAQVPPPGAGRTSERWRLLATLGAWDLVQARVAEPHVDALAILYEAGTTEPEGTWGVWAAEGVGADLRATPADPAEPDGPWRLDGNKPWCSLARDLTHALVSARTGGEDGSSRVLLAVDLDQPGVVADPGGWASLGLREVETCAVRFDAADGHPVGRPGWYLQRPGFAWGGIGVAAVWFGGAVGLARRLEEQARRREPDQVALVHLGAVDARLAAAGALLERSARLVDAGEATGHAGARLAARVRQVVADAAEEVLWRCAHAMGPAPLTGEPEHARRVADLTVYLRQHHAERDAAALGRLILEGGQS